MSDAQINEALQRAIIALREAGLEVNSENLVALLEKAKPESRLMSSRPTVQRVWFRIQCGFFETVVSYVHATTVEEAIDYTSSSHCEWYRIRDVSDETFRGASFETTQLNHDEFNQWCAKMWPGTAVSDTQQTT